MQDFKNLAVWQAARRLTKRVYEITSPFPEEEQFGLKAQMRRASISICSNIAEGRGRGGDPDFRRFLIIAMGSACELECELILSRDLVLIEERQQVTTLGMVTEVKQMLSGLIKRLSPLPPQGPKATR